MFVCNSKRKNKMERLETARQRIYDGKTDEAIALLDALLRENPAAAEAFYLRGNAYRKKGDWQQALNNYLAAMELHPEGPAKQAHDMLMKILDFYNKDMYNH